jgi:uncharacterized protein YcgL (UPF0745 family)
MSEPCKVYRSGKRDDTYLYVAHGRDFDDLPDTLRQAFGEPQFVMHLQLGPERRLARVEVEQVLAALAEQGYFLQLPPDLPIEEEIARRFS